MAALDPGLHEEPANSGSGLSPQTLSNEQLLWPTKGLGLLWGQKVLENILLMTLQLMALFRPFQEIRRILWWEWLRGGGWRENLESLKKKKKGFPPTSVGKVVPAT